MLHDDSAWASCSPTLVPLSPNRILCGWEGSRRPDIAVAMCYSGTNHTGFMPPAPALGEKQPASASVGVKGCHIGWLTPTEA